MADPCGTFFRRIEIDQKEIQKPLVFGGVFASFCRRGQKGVAPEREISPPEAKKSNREKLPVGDPSH